MAKWMMLLALSAVAAGASSYAAFKTYQMTDGKAVPKARR
jgi:uncharacterized lipoprotein YmbA